MAIKRLAPSFALLLVLSIVFLSFQLNSASQAQPNPLDFRSLLQQLQTTYLSKIPVHMQNLSEFGSRTTGYSSSQAAAEYIYNAFVKANLSNVAYENFTVTVPIDHGASIEVVNSTSSTVGTIQAFPLLPNLANPCATPPDGITGTLVYAGQGNLTDFNGQNVTDSIVMMDFNSQDHWINAAMLGAKAVVFIEPSNTSRFEAATKTVDTPINVPRVYISMNDSRSLLNLMNQTRVVVNLKSSMNFEVAEARNVVGLVNGSEFPDEVIVISSYYDSSSIVPSLSPGADEATGVSALLELASFFSNNPPSRTLMFVAFAGHNQQAAGAREFVYQHRSEINSRLKVLLNLDLSTTSETVVDDFRGWLYKFNFVEFNGGLYGANSWMATLFSQTVLSELKSETGRNYDVQLALIQDWVERNPVRYVLDHEPFEAAGGPAVTFFTSNSFRLRWDTPLDTYQNVDVSKLQAQVEYVFASVYAMANLGASQFALPSLGSSFFSLNYKSFVGYATLTGRVVQYSLLTGLFEPVPNALVFIRPNQAGVLAPDLLMSTVTTADSQGGFEIHGVSDTQPDFPWSYFIEAYVVNSTGYLTYAPDFGSQASQYSRTFSINADPIYATATVFQCGTFAIYGLNNPYSLNPVGAQADFTVRDTVTHTALSSFGFRGSGNAAAIFAPPGNTVEIVGNIPGVNEPALLITNSSENYPQGYGYSLQTGESFSLGYAFAATIRDIAPLTTNLQASYEAYQIKSPDVTTAMQKAQQIFQLAQEFYTQQEYDQWIAHVQSAYVFYQDAFSGARSVLTDISSSVVLFSVLLVPFVAVLEQLLFEYKGIRRMVAMIILYGIFLAIFNLVNPGLRLAANLPIVIVGVIALMLAFPPIFIIYNEGLSFLREARRRLVGGHFAEVGRLSAVLLAFLYGIMSMKKRRARTLLTMLSIVLVIYSLTLFTSTSFFTVVRARESSGVTLYDGIYLRTVSWSSPLSQALLDTLKSQYGTESGVTVSGRVWLYPPASVTPGYVELQSQNSSVVATSVLGLTPEEAVMTRANDTLVEGRWFTQDDVYATVLADKLASQLNASAGGFVSWANTQFKVVGIMNSTKFAAIQDFDQESITPRDTVASTTNLHIAPQSTFVIPYRTASLLGGLVYNISMRLSSVDQAANVSSTLATTYARSLDIYGGGEGKILFYRRGGGTTVGGLSFIAVPAAIGILIILNTAIDTVHGRRREIGTFTVVGLAPIHIAGMFLAEFFVYAIVGAVMGYLMGTATTFVLVSFKVLPPGLNVNASSSLVLYVIGFAIASVLLSVLYPLREAARISVPSIERAWKMPTKPKGDEWLVPLPFVVSSPEEAEGTLAYLYEYFEIFRSESAGGNFAASELNLEEKEEEGVVAKKMSARLHLAPFDLGIIQKGVVSVTSTKGGPFQFSVKINREEGPLYAWAASNRGFVDRLRKQLLLWRSLKPDEKAKYAERYRSLIKKEEQK